MPQFELATRWNIWESKSQHSTFRLLGPKSAVNLQLAISPYDQRIFQELEVSSRMIIFQQTDRFQSVAS